MVAGEDVGGDGVRGLGFKGLGFGLGVRVRVRG